MAKMKENSRKVFEYLKANNGADLTAADVAAIECIALLDPSATTVPPAAKFVPLNVIVELLSAPVIV